MTVSPSMPDPAHRPDPDRDLVVLLSRALRALGDAGRPVAANRLAAKAWWSLKDTDPKGAQRVNGVMHYLAGLGEEEVGHDPRPAVATAGARPAGNVPRSNGVK